MNTSLKTMTITLALVLMAATAQAGAFTFTPAAGYTATEIWSGTDAAHFAVDGDAVYVYGSTSDGNGQLQNVVRRVDGSSETEVARSASFNNYEKFADAITVVNGDVYWGHTGNFAPGHVFKSSFDGTTWSTETVIDPSSNLIVYSLSTDGTNVFGVALDNNAGSNQAFAIDPTDNTIIVADGIGSYSGGSGFDANGTFYAGGFGSAGNIFAFSAQQVADRLDGTQATPYADTDATAIYAVPNNGSAVMESDDTGIYGTTFNASYGSEPYRFNLADGATEILGAFNNGTTITTDTYYRDGAIYFMAKNSFSTGSLAAIYKLTPEPATLMLVAFGGVAMIRRNRRR